MPGICSLILALLLNKLDYPQFMIQLAESEKNLREASIALNFPSSQMNEGVGAKVRRTIGTSRLRNLDPFLMLDLFTVRLPDGFPDHPHRGFETVTYMLSGKLYHEDFKGHKGEINPGDVQWMTAGKGIVHAEIPASKNEEATGFQLWINLPKNKKMIDPHYQEFTKAQIPLLDMETIKVKVISGNLHGINGVVNPTSPIEYFDVHLNSGAAFSLKISKGFNTFVYFYHGQGQVNGKIIEKNHAVVFDQSANETKAYFRAQNEELKFIWISGLPLNEPITQYGPFVMSTMDEVKAAMTDYQLNRNGFENASSWESKIQKLMDN